MNLSFRGCLRPLLCGLIALTGLGLGACNNAINTGVAPLYLSVTKPNTATVVSNLQMYECLTSGLSAIMYFSNGSAGNFTSRVTWSSSNTGAVQVSNGDIPIPGTTSSFYPSGTLVPVHNGNAIITANYYGIQSQTVVSVSAPEYFTMEALVHGSRVPLDLYNDVNKTGNSPYGNNFYMGGGTTLQLSVIANLNGVETDVSSFGVWGFKNYSSTDNVGATINPTTGLITAGNVQSPQLVPIVTFPSCPQELTLPIDQYNLMVYPVQSIALSPEYDPTPTNGVTTLYAGNEERINVIGTLNNGALQDVSSQATMAITANGSSNMAFISNGADANNLLHATALKGGQGAATVSATYAVGGQNLFSGYVVVQSPANQLTQFYLCYSSTTVAFDPSQCSLEQSTTQPNAQVVAGSLTPVQYHAVGIWGTDSNNNPILQEVTRTTNWSTNNANATISNGASVIGQALGVSVGQTLINATNANLASVGGQAIVSTELSVIGASAQTN